MSPSAAVTVPRARQDEGSVCDPPGPADHHLLALLAALDVEGIDVAQVRPPARDGLDRVEADLLVRPGQLAAAERLLAADGFLHRRAWGRRPHRFHLRPVSAAPGGPFDWLKVDLVTDLCFGTLHEFTSDIADACLDARTLADRAAHRLAPADELAALLIHGLLDGAELRPDQRARLLELAEVVSRTSDTSGLLADVALAPTEWAGLLAAIERSDWGAVLGARPTLRARLIRGRRASTTARRLRNRLARRSTKALTALAGRGRSVAVVGTDGSGKSTLTAALASSTGIPTRVLYGGTHPAGTRRSTLPGGTTARIVARLLGTRARLVWHRGRGRLVILDRHPLEVRPIAGATLSARTRRRRRVLAATLPRPDLLIVLDAPALVLHARRPEHEIERLAADRAAHLELAEDDGVVVVDATEPAEHVRHEVVRLVWERVLTTDTARATVVGR